MTNYCIGLLATKLIGSSLKAYCVTYPLRTASRHLSAMVGTPAAEKWCGSLLSNSLAPGSVQPLKLALPNKPSCYSRSVDCRFIRLYFFVLGNPRAKNQVSRPRIKFKLKNQVSSFKTKFQVSRSSFKFQAY